MPDECPLCHQGRMESCEEPYSRLIGDDEYAGVIAGRQCVVCGESLVACAELRRFEQRVAEELIARHESLPLTGEEQTFVRKAHKRALDTLAAR